MSDPTSQRFSAMLEGLQRSGLSIRQISEQSGLHLSVVYCGIAGSVRNPSWNTVEKVQRLVAKSTKPRG